MRITKLFNFAFVLWAGLVRAYLVTPPGPAAPGSNVDCTEWVQQSYALTCAIIEEFYGLTTAEFEAWNPSVLDFGTNCTLLSGLYYCVQINFIPESTLNQSPPSSSTTSFSTTSSTSILATTTTTGNGISTPTPYQTGMATNCNAFHLVVSGDQCGTVASNAGVSLNDFYLWNPAVGSSCSFLDLGDYVCIGILPIATCTSATALAAPTQYASTCGPPGFSHDGANSLLLVSYTSGANVASAGACGAACLANVACTNLYFQQGAYCNLHEEAPSFQESTAAGYYSWFEANCFTTGEACGSLGFSRGNGLIVSYTTGIYVSSPGSCGAICLATATCTNVYFIQGKYCNLHSGDYTYFNSTASGYYSWYQYDCFTC